MNGYDSRSRLMLDVNNACIFCKSNAKFAVPTLTGKAVQSYSGEWDKWIRKKIKMNATQYLPKE